MSMGDRLEPGCPFRADLVEEGLVSGAHVDAVTESTPKARVIVDRFRARRLAPQPAITLAGGRTGARAVGTLVLPLPGDLDHTLGRARARQPGGSA